MKSVTNLCFDTYTKGRVLSLDKDEIWKYYKGTIYKSTNGGEEWNSIINLYPDFFTHFLSKSSLFSRLYRKGVHHIQSLDNGIYCAFYDKNVIFFKGGEIITTSPIHGSRPLAIEKFGNSVVYGEYCSNQDRKEVSVWQADCITKEHKAIIVFDNIRHIHGIYKDTSDNSFWITTGDENHESGILRATADFNNIENVLDGSQQTRTIKLLFDAEYVYFGSDTPSEKNYIYRLHKKTRELERLCEVGSSVFHGCKVNNWLFFSTAVEPSLTNETKYSEIWASCDGKDWRCIMKFKKDFWNKKLFQYGQIFFPVGQNESNFLWFSPFATKKTNKSFCVSIDKVKEFYNNYNSLFY